MAIFEFMIDQIRKVNETTFSAAGLKECADLQRLLRKQIDVILPDTLVIAEEFGEWEDSKRRIDLLGIDRNANLVVIELKRTEEGGHMELQAIRYAAMVSTMTFERAVDLFAASLSKWAPSQNGEVFETPGADARSRILEFLGWDDAAEEQFAPDRRIVLVSADFSKELTTAVLWLNERDLDIRCIRLKPYSDNGRILVDVQQVIPLPETANYTIQLKHKNQQERVAKASTKDQTKFDVTVGGETNTGLSKREAIFRLVKGLWSQGVKPDAMSGPEIPDRLFIRVPGNLKHAQFVEAAIAKRKQVGKGFDPGRWYCKDDELVVLDGNTYAISNQWGSSTETVMDALLKAFPDKGVTVKQSE